MANYDEYTIVTPIGTIEVTTGNFVLDNYAIPSPSTLTCEDHIEVRAWNDGDNITHVTPITLKKGITLHYKNVANSTYKKIRDYIIKEKLIKTGSMTYDVKTLFLGEDEPINMKMIVGSPMISNLVYGSRYRTIVSFDLHFTEPEGIALEPVTQ